MRSEVSRIVKANHSLVFGSSVLLLLVIAVFLGSFSFLPDPNRMEIAHRLKPPSLSHPFGTDQFGRDVFSRIIHGSRATLLVGGLVVAISSLGGLLIGAWSGFRGGWFDEAMMRFMDGMMAFPGLLLAVMVISIMGPGLGNVAIAVGVGNIPAFARLVRADFLRLREKEFVEAARALGASEKRIIFVHVLPNIAGPFLVQATVAFATAVLSEAALSYLGLGTQPPDPSWGRMLKEAQVYMGRAPWLPIAPGLALTITILAVNSLGDGLRDFFARKR